MIDMGKLLDAVCLAQTPRSSGEAGSLGETAPSAARPGLEPARKRALKPQAEAVAAAPEAMTSPELTAPREGASST
ncbi:MAG TPA: hypothetical protein VKS60_11110 [Stellaceae bacterium]|nr:hypothetical protein [Stellaceae bacterium]